MTKKLPIFIISGKSPLGESGGYPAYSYNLSQILTNGGFSVHTFAIQTHNKRSKKKIFGRIHFSQTLLTSIFPFLRYLALTGLPYYSILLYRSMYKILDGLKNDACIVWGMGPWTFPGILLKLFPPPGKRVFVVANYFTSTRHEMKGAYNSITISDYGVIPKLKYFFVYEFVARIFHVFESIALKICDRVVVHYKSSKNIVQSYFHIGEEKFRMFPWYVDVFPRDGDRSNSKLSYRHPLIVSICRQDPRKGLNFIIHAMINVVKEFPNAQCLIIGSGEFLELNKRLVDKLGLSRTVSVIGFVPDIRPVLKEADIAVIVPLAQGSSALTVLEAMSYGKAVIGSDCDGIPEDITTNVTGIIVPPADQHALSRAICDLLRNPSKRKKLGNAAFLAYKKMFGSDQLSKNISTVFKEFTT